MGDCLRVKKELDKAKQQKQWEEAAKSYREGIKLAPHKLEAYDRLAQLLRNDQKKPGAANQVLEEMIQANDKDPRAFLIRAAFRQSGFDQVTNNWPALAARVFGIFGSPANSRTFFPMAELLLPKSERDLFGANQDLVAAGALAPDDINVMLASSYQEILVARERGQADPKAHFEKARATLLRAQALYPDEKRLLPQLAALELAGGRRKEALDYLRAAQKKALGAERAYLLENITNLLIDDNNLDEAKEILDQMKKGRVPEAKLDFLSQNQDPGRKMVRSG